MVIVGLEKLTKKIDVRRTEYGDDAAFSFISDAGIEVQVLGPIVEPVNGKPAFALSQDTWLELAVCPYAFSVDANGSIAFEDSVKMI